jgi:hypothetical protein
MAAEQETAGALSRDPEGWYEQDFRKARKEVRRLQARIVKATPFCGETASLTGRFRGLSRVLGNGLARF